MKTVSMKMDAADRKSMLSQPSVEDQQYPWGTQIRLGKSEIEKLGLAGDMPNVGSQMNFTGVGKVVSVGMSSNEGQEPSLHIEVQITELGMEPVDTEKSKREPWEVLYGKPKMEG